MSSSYFEFRVFWPSTSMEMMSYLGGKNPQLSYLPTMSSLLLPPDETGFCSSTEQKIVKYIFTAEQKLHW